LGELNAAEGERSLLSIHSTESSASGTGLLGAKQVGLLFQQSGESPFGQASRSGGSDLLHDVEIDIGARPSHTEGVPGNNFAPLGRQFTDFLEGFGGEFARCHGLSCLVLARIEWGAFLLPLYGIALCIAKPVVTSRFARR
jgi:hypothetical protein